MHIFYTDGSTKNNGQYGKQESYTCVTDEQGKVIKNTPIGDKTNIEAEGLAILECLQHIVDNKQNPATIKSDSQFWVRVIQGKYKLKKERLFPIRDDIRDILNHHIISFEWVPREINLAGFFLEHKYEKGWKPTEKKPKVTHKKTAY